MTLTTARFCPGLYKSPSFLGKPGGRLARMEPRRCVVKSLLSDLGAFGSIIQLGLINGVETGSLRTFGNLLERVVSLKQVIQRGFHQGKPSEGLRPLRHLSLDCSSFP